MVDLIPTTFLSLNNWLQPYGIHIGGFETIITILAALAFFARKIIFRAVMTYIVYALVFFLMARIVKPIAMGMLLTM